MTEISRTEALEVWLEEKPPEASVAVAVRAALRVLPLVANSFADTAEHRPAGLILAVFRALAVARLAGTWPSLAVEVHDAADSAAIYAYTTATASTYAATRAADAAYATARAAEAAYNATIAAEVAADAIAYATADLAKAAVLWREVDHDVRTLDGDTAPERLMCQALWTGGTPDWFGAAWATLKTTLPDGQNWQVWTAWYDDIVAGAGGSRRDRFIEDLELNRVLIPREDWDRGPAHVNDLIAELEREYREPVTQDGGTAKGGTPSA